MKSAHVAVLMAGGSGTRFWPWSRPDFPKQFLALTGERSLIQQTRDRLLPFVDAGSIYVCATQDQEKLIREQLPDAELFLEPMPRNTAPCLMLSVKSLLDRGYGDDTVMFALPADHMIQRPDIFERSLHQAAQVARDTRGLVLLGIVPNKPHTGYGYIEANGAGPVHGVTRFVEKPNAERAAEFLRSGNFFWNSGIFIWTLGAIRGAFEAHLAGPWEALMRAEHPADAYPSLPSQPIDIAILEKATNRSVIPVDMGWSDVGSWAALHELLAATPTENLVLGGDAKAWDSQGCLVRAPGQKIALIGVENLIVVQDGDRLLITTRDADQKVRQAATHFDP